MSDQPPSYDQAVGSTSASASSHLQVPGSSANTGRVPLQHRRSIEDEGRELPPGWIRQYDHKNNHQYFVDTKTAPPRSIWHHPYDDDTYLRTLSSEERERIEERQRPPHPPSNERIINAESDVENDHYEPQLPPRAAASSGSGKFGRKLKDKITGTTHEQREEQRRRQAEEDAARYRLHQRIREAMQKAFETGEPQLIDKDKNGREVYIEPPRGGPFSQSGGYGYNPYSNGPYQQPYIQGNSRYIPYPAPAYPYNGRPAYGYGMGMPLMGGLLGGAVLGGLMF